ncbi:MAG: hypothetical protein GXO22_01715 [Aquificae bacterium]|nr:hypothetical protein [Aquificota bacterium]
MERVENKEKKKSLEELDTLPAEHFIKPYEIVLFTVLVLFVLFIIFPKKKETPYLHAERETKTPEKEKVSKFSLEYIKNLLKTSRYSQKEEILKRYIDELLTAGRTDLAYQVLQNYKVYIKNPLDYLLIEYKILAKKYIQTTSKKEKAILKKRITQVLNLILSKGYNDIKLIKFVYTQALKYNDSKLVEKALYRLYEIDRKNRLIWLEKLITYKVSNKSYKGLSTLIKTYASFIETVNNYSKKKEIMKKSIDTLLLIHDYETLSYILEKYRHFFIKDPKMTKFMIKSALMANKPSLAAKISQEFLEGSQ